MAILHALGLKKKTTADVLQGITTLIGDLDTIAAQEADARDAALVEVAKFQAQAQKAAVAGKEASVIADKFRELVSPISSMDLASDDRPDENPEAK